MQVTIKAFSTNVQTAGYKMLYRIAKDAYDNTYNGVWSPNKYEIIGTRQLCV